MDAIERRDAEIMALMMRAALRASRERRASIAAQSLVRHRTRHSPSGARAQGSLASSAIGNQMTIESPGSRGYVAGETAAMYPVRSTPTSRAAGRPTATRHFTSPVAVLPPVLATFRISASPRWRRVDRSSKRITDAATLPVLVDIGDTRLGQRVQHRARARCVLMIGV